MAEDAAEFAAESTNNPEEFYLRGDRLVSQAQNVASAEALMQAQLGYLSVCKKKPENRLAYLFSIVARGADDSWSGRKNDSKRSSFDAVRSWASDQADSIRYEG
jgi:hypothetical protein